MTVRPATRTSALAEEGGGGWLAWKRARPGPVCRVVQGRARPTQGTHQVWKGFEPAVARLTQIRSRERPPFFPTPKKKPNPRRAPVDFTVTTTHAPTHTQIRRADRVGDHGNRVVQHGRGRCHAVDACLYRPGLDHRQDHHVSVEGGNEGATLCVSKPAGVQHPSSFTPPPFPFSPQHLWRGRRRGRRCRDL